MDKNEPILVLGKYGPDARKLHSELAQTVIDQDVDIGDAIDAAFYLLVGQLISAPMRPKMIVSTAFKLGEHIFGAVCYNLSKPAVRKSAGINEDDYQADVAEVQYAAHQESGREAN